MGKIHEAVNKAKQFVSYLELKEGKAEAHLSNRDVFVSAPRGTRKCLTFELALYALEHLTSNEKSMVLVIVP